MPCPANWINHAGAMAQEFNRGEQRRKFWECLEPTKIANGVSLSPPVAAVNPRSALPDKNGVADFQVEDRQR